jgi:hypothetical protein
MPQLVKGAKWVFGWVAVGPGGEITIPPDAWREYGFQAGDEAIFTPGSRRSGGFGISAPGLMAEVREKMAGAGLRELGRGQFEDGRVTPPPEIGVKPDDRLLAVRGSRYALGFLAKGPIYDEALKHANIKVFGEEHEN